MLCRGTATFEVSYGGQTTEVSALVSPDLNDDDVLLGWKALQRLRIIPENFPSPTKALTVKVEPLDPQVASVVEVTRREEMREKAKVDFDGKRKHLTGLEVGANVYCQDFKTKRWNRKGTIIRTTKRNRTYQVEIEGRKFWRNIKFLRKDPGDPDDLEETKDPVADRPKGPVLAQFDQNTPKTPEVPQLRRSTRTRRRTRKSLSTY